MSAAEDHSLEVRVKVLEQVVAQGLNISLDMWHEAIDLAEERFKEAQKQAKHRTAAFRKMKPDEIDALIAEHGIVLDPDATKQDKVAAVDAHPAILTPDVDPADLTGIATSPETPPRAPTPAEQLAPEPNELGQIPAVATPTSGTTKK